MDAAIHPHFDWEPRLKATRLWFLDVVQPPTVVIQWRSGDI